MDYKTNTNITISSNVLAAAPSRENSLLRISDGPAARILSFLPTFELLNQSLVCKQFYKIIRTSVNESPFHVLFLSNSLEGNKNARLDDLVLRQQFADNFEEQSFEKAKKIMQLFFSANRGSLLRNVERIVLSCSEPSQIAKKAKTTVGPLLSLAESSLSSLLTSDARDGQDMISVLLHKKIDLFVTASRISFADALEEMNNGDFPTSLVPLGFNGTPLDLSSLSSQTIWKTRTSSSLRSLVLSNVSVPKKGAGDLLRSIVFLLPRLESLSMNVKADSLQNIDPIDTDVLNATEDLGANLRELIYSSNTLFDGYDTSVEVFIRSLDNLEVLIYRTSVVLRDLKVAKKKNLRVLSIPYACFDTQFGLLQKESEGNTPLLPRLQFARIGLDSVEKIKTFIETAPSLKTLVLQDNTFTHCVSAKVVKSGLEAALGNLEIIFV